MCICAWRPIAPHIVRVPAQEDRSRPIRAVHKVIHPALDAELPKPSLAPCVEAVARATLCVHVPVARNIALTPAADGASMPRLVWDSVETVADLSSPRTRIAAE